MLEERQQKTPHEGLCGANLTILMPLALLLPIALAITLAWLGQQWRVLPSALEPYGLQPVQLDSTHELAALFASHDYHWPPEQAVPPLALTAFPEDLAEQPVEYKKTLFFRALTPMVLAENRRLRDKRIWLELRLDTNDWTPSEREELEYLMIRYRIEPEGAEPDLWIRQLLRHVDEVPLALVLAQAANESGWGGSRFTREANNLFGEWTWQAEEGIAPLIRDAQSSHYVRRFDSLQDSVRAYMYNINVGHAYTELREMRARMRVQGAKRLDALALASGLLRYSERGEEYVAEIQAMIRGNQLHQLEPLKLSALK